MQEERTRDEHATHRHRHRHSDATLAEEQAARTKGNHKKGRETTTRGGREGAEKEDTRGNARKQTSTTRTRKQTKRRVTAPHGSSARGLTETNTEKNSAVFIEHSMCASRIILAFYRACRPRDLPDCAERPKDGSHCFRVSRSSAHRASVAAVSACCAVVCGHVASVLRDHCSPSTRPLSVLSRRIRRPEWREE